MHETLEDLRRAGHVALSNRSVMFLSLGLEEARKFVEVFKNAELKQPVTITCLSKINKNSPDEDAINCLVVGTEHKCIYVIDTEAFTILTTVKNSFRFRQKVCEFFDNNWAFLLLKDGMSAHTSVH
jgi:hypothetical protein